MRKSKQNKQRRKKDTKAMKTKKNIIKKERREANKKK
tara:strand:+ start:1405 stop:1515 length:111 start_codon:yes stop_codon:yes gene_type:complete